jgi:hypothetical protein
MTARVISIHDAKLKTVSVGIDQAQESWLAIRKEAALEIDPETADVDWDYVQTLDPYGVHPDLREECWQVGREYFARSPGSDVWVWFGDLPEAVRDRLRERFTCGSLVFDNWS